MRKGVCPCLQLHRDGMTALLEYAWGTDDTAPSFPNEVYELTGPPNNLSFVTQKNLSADDAIITIQTSSDLNRWVSADALLEPSNEEHLGNGIARYTWTPQASADPGSQLFIRILVEQR